MTNTKLILKLLSIDESLINIFIKPKQLEVLKKQLVGQRLTENEKRYERGKLRAKLELLAQFGSGPKDVNDYQVLLNIIDKYYITGLEALKYHGFGWYYKPKLIEIINTRLEGKIRLRDITLKFIRVKSMSNSKFETDKKTGLKYATTEQVILDIKYSKNEYTKTVWQNMLNRYKSYFIEHPDRYEKYYFKHTNIDVSMFRV